MDQHLATKRKHLHYQKESLGSQTLKKHHGWELFSKEWFCVPNDVYEKYLVMQE